MFTTRGNDSERQAGTWSAKWISMCIGCTMATGREPDGCDARTAPARSAQALGCGGCGGWCFFGWRFRRLRFLISAGEARRIAANHRQAARVVDRPRNLIQPAELCWVSGHETTPPSPHPSFLSREAPLPSVARGFLLPPIRNKPLNGAAAGCRKHPTATCHNVPGNRRVVTDYDISKNMFAVGVVLLNALSFASLAYIANRKGHHTVAALAAAGACLALTQRVGLGVAQWPPRLVALGNSAPALF
jgi:hypothetical protein